MKRHYKTEPLNFLLLCLFVPKGNLLDFYIRICFSTHMSLIMKTRLFKYIEKFTTKNWKFSDKNSDIFQISAQNIDCWYSLEPPRPGGSNEYPQSMFLSRNKNNNLYPCKPKFYYIKVGFNGMGSKLYRYVFVMSKMKLFAPKGIIERIPGFWKFIWGSLMRPNWPKVASQAQTLRKHVYWNILKNLPPKNENFQIKNSDIFHISAQIIDCGYSLEPPRWGGSNEYLQSMFLSRNKKTKVYPCKPQFYYIKLGFKGIKII